VKYSEVIIIGAGPAGLSAAIQLKRYGITPIIFEKDEAGGVLRNANLVENYLGFPKGITGPGLVTQFKDQFGKNDLKITYQEIHEIVRDGDQFIVETDNKKFTSDYLIIASGTKPIKFQKFELSQDVRSRIFYEVYSLVKEKNKNIGIVGVGDAALDYSINLAQQNKIILLNRSEKISGLPLLWERVQKNSAINYYSNSEINGIKWTGSKLEIDVNVISKLLKFQLDFLIFAIGREPELGFLKNNEIEGLGKIDKPENLYVIGDVKNGLFRQTSISVGEGIKAAMKIYTKKQVKLK
jgi:thioredoxin reductase (NADPH)